MKRETLLLLFVLLLSATGLRAQQVNSLPAGHYDARIKGSQAKWNLGDLQLDSDGSYSMSNSREGGSYKFSAAAQRVFLNWHKHLPKQKKQERAHAAALYL